MIFCKVISSKKADKKRQAKGREKKKRGQRGKKTTYSGSMTMAEFLSEGYVRLVDPMLNEEEREELKKYPIGSNGFATLQNDKKRFGLRKSVSRKIWNMVCEPMMTDIGDDEGLKETYRNYPPYCFFGDKNAPASVRRIYGVCYGEKATATTKNAEPEAEKEEAEPQKEFRLHACSAMLGWVNDVVGGVPVEDAVILEEWSEEQLEKISFCPAASFYYDPCGWVVFPYV